jgi:hypothetical protein
VNICWHLPFSTQDALKKWEIDNYNFRIFSQFTGIDESGEKNPT